MTALSVSHGTTARAEWQPILCRCPRWRRGLLADHRDHVAELERLRAAGCLVDELWFAAVSIEPTLREEATV